MAGPLGDKVGRQKIMVVTVTLMALDTRCIGLLPTFESAGLLAPVLLLICRLVQGFSVGSGFELDAIAAVFIGGASVQGGVGTVVGTAARSGDGCAEPGPFHPGLGPILFLFGLLGAFTLPVVQAAGFRRPRRF